MKFALILLVPLLFISCGGGDGDSTPPQVIDRENLENENSVSAQQYFTELGTYESYKKHAELGSRIRVTEDLNVQVTGSNCVFKTVATHTLYSTSASEFEILKETSLSIQTPNDPVCQTMVPGQASWKVLYSYDTDKGLTLFPDNTDWEFVENFYKELGVSFHKGQRSGVDLFKRVYTVKDVVVDQNYIIENEQEIDIVDPRKAYYFAKSFFNQKIKALISGVTYNVNTTETVEELPSIDVDNIDMNGVLNMIGEFPGDIEYPVNETSSQSISIQNLVK